MSDHICPDGPFEVELKIKYSDGDDTIATVAYTLPPGKLPTDEDVMAAIRMATAAVPEGFTILGRHAFVQELLGGGFAVPGPDEFRLKP